MLNLSPVTLITVGEPAGTQVTSTVKTIGPVYGGDWVAPGAEAAAKVNDPEPVADPVFVFVTTTLAAPAVPAGVVHVMEVAETTTTFTHGLPPTLTVAPATNPVPVIVMAVPPAAGPSAGETWEMVGRTKYVKALVLVAVPLLVVVTTTFTNAADLAAVVHVIVVGTVTTMFVQAVPPNVTDAPASKLVPVIVTLVPPAIGPPEGATVVMVAVFWYVNPLTLVAEEESVFVTTTSLAPRVPAGVVQVI